MASITYTGNDGVAVEFVELGSAPVAEVIKDEIVENTDGTTETLVPEQEVETPAEDATETTEEPA